GGNRDLLPHLETHLELLRDLIQVSSQLVRGGRSIERRIIPHGCEERLPLVLILRILTKAFLSKLGLRILAFVHLALPAFVGPGGGAEANERRGRHGSECTATR